MFQLDTMRLSVFLGALCFTTIDSALAVTYTFNKVADTSTLIPKGIGTFLRFDTISATISNAEVVFMGEGGGDQRGLYKASGPLLSVIADTATAVPDQSGGNRFSFFGTPVTKNGVTVFRARFKTPQTSASVGIYSGNESTLNRVVDSTMQVANSNNSLVRLAPNDPVFDGTVVAFKSGPSAAWTAEAGQLSNIIDASNPDILGIQAILDTENNRVLFYGVGRNTLVSTYYFWENGFVKNATITTSLNPFATPQAIVDNGTVAYIDIKGKTSGIFDAILGISITDGTTTTSLLTEETPLPDPIKAAPSIGKVDLGLGLTPFSFDNGVLAVAEGSACTTSLSCPLSSVITDINVYIAPSLGIYATFGGQISKVIDADDTLDGKEIKGLSIGRHALDGNTLVFFALFKDGSQGIYTATASATTVPESTGPQVAADLALALSTPKSVKAGKKLLYTFTARNKTKVATPAVVINAQLPNTVTLIKKPKYCAVTRNQLACDLGTLGKKKAKRFSIKVQTTIKGLLTTIASISSVGVNDTNLVNNAVSKSTTVK